MDLYHVDICLPSGFALPDRYIGLSWTKHALGALKNDRYGDIPLNTGIHLSDFDVIEVGVSGGKRVEKVVIRGTLDTLNDIIYVLIPYGFKPWIVKTVWINRKNDLHKTLDHTRYMR